MALFQALKVPQVPASIYKDPTGRVIRKAGWLICKVGLDAATGSRRGSEHDDYVIRYQWI